MIDVTSYSILFDFEYSSFKNRISLPLVIFSLLLSLSISLWIFFISQTSPSPSSLPRHSYFSYALEGLNMTQFYRDRTPVMTTTGRLTTAEAYMNGFYQDWHYSNRGYDVMALIIFIVALRYAKCREEKKKDKE